jgi:LDH2 family malate/lactate/ureidoglycolate dehydrogenase
MPGKGLGHFFGAMGVDAFRPAHEFKQHMDRWITRFRNAKPADGHDKVLIPGDPEREIESIRIREGIPIVDMVAEDLKRVGTKFGIEL